MFYFSVWRWTGKFGFTDMCNGCSVYFIRSTGETARPLRWDGSCLWTRKHQLWRHGFLKEPLKPDVLSSLFDRYKNQVYNCELLSFRMHVLDIHWFRPGQCIKPVVSCKNSILVQKSNYKTWWGRNLKNILEPWNQRLNTRNFILWGLFWVCELLSHKVSRLYL